MGIIGATLEKEGWRVCVEVDWLGVANQNGGADDEYKEKQNFPKNIFKKPCVVDCLELKSQLILIPCS
ncbi:hypothetical protein L6452_37106 [Arctium lappa]|uniref:Uncharacterized protein n=1 Tax=Arctium lappa TaxID=4217 RepID=A0ACB8Y2S4_ARCLA|nr:hypothetical protein L6452_37106 [Arctium lappa]